jgi:hypothetical protein
MTTQIVPASAPETAPVHETLEAEALPKDLQAQDYTIKAFAQTFTMLQDGLFPTTHFGAVQSCLAFLKEVHAASLEKASQHEKADLVPELKAYKEKKAAEKKSVVEAENGQA